MSNYPDNEPQHGPSLLNPTELSKGPTAHKPGHERTGSAYSHNYSLLDIYGLESPVQGDDESTASEDLHDPAVSTHMKSFDDLDFRDHSQDHNTLVTQSTYKIPDIEIRENYVMKTTPNNESKVLNSQFDRYGFKKSSNVNGIDLETYNEWFKDYSEYSHRHKKKWELLMKNHGLQLSKHDPIPTRFPPKSDKVKKMIRRGIPPEWRGNAWFFYAGGYDKLNKNIGVYNKIVEDTRNISNKNTEVIERDLNRTFPDNIYFNSGILPDGSTSDMPLESREETQLIKSLRRVLVAFSYYQPQIGYCQSLNFLAGLLLLFMTEEKAFWMLVILTERIIPKVHSQNLEGVHTDQGVLMLCVKEYIPQLWSILGKNFEGEKLSKDKILTRLPPVTLVTSSWFMSLFVGILPTESTLRVWDILWCEGSKTIFRFSLTILKLCLDSPDFQETKQNSGGAETEQIELFQFLQNFPKKLVDINGLVDLCFKKIGGYGFGSLSQDEINNCREFVSKQREKLKNKRIMSTSMTEEERNSLMNSSDGGWNTDEDVIHDVYGFHRPIMGGVVWNRSISNKMKIRFSKRNSKP
ncbi:uncharacterized protein J8A68_004960 [[Candida] subhashii]|uniref:Rab-GAP TBC domain-containing protein n=1 Tax=[Candida] subhashii TaxID=561895 RepID=A0A8J5UJZ0_9ASCO|nr:uncharacterized protein J8A68_004960 [[Candida] subhashii]KAG7661501.1 hypothetical protein J8A68_004960 [[Candida] subhashii]